MVGFRSFIRLPLGTAEECKIIKRRIFSATGGSFSAIQLPRHPTMFCVRIDYTRKKERGLSRSIGQHTEEAMSGERAGEGKKCGFTTLASVSQQLLAGWLGCWWKDLLSSGGERQKRHWKVVQQIRFNSCFIFPKLLGGWVDERRRGSSVSPKDPFGPSQDSLYWIYIGNIFVLNNPCWLLWMAIRPAVDDDTKHCPRRTEWPFETVWPKWRFCWLFCVFLRSFRL